MTRHCKTRGRLLCTAILCANIVKSSCLAAYARSKHAVSKTTHFVYTVGCDDYQVLGAVALDHSWREVGNEGKLTRIVSGCSDVAKRHFLETSPLSGDPHFSVFFADGDLTTQSGHNKSYPARARPHSIELWLQKTAPTEDVVAILDPDMVFRLPLAEHTSMRYVRPGFMLAQAYNHGPSWIRFADAGEERPKVSRSDTYNVYATGPPWALDISDLRRILPDWKRYTDVQKGDDLMKEQFAFNMAAFKQEIPSSGSWDLMVSEPGGRGEAFGESPDWNDGQWDPFLIHYDQTYRYKTWNFHKSLFSHGWYADHFVNSLPTPLECGAPLPEEPPPMPTAVEEPDAVKRQSAFIFSELIPRLSRAFKATRTKICPPEDFDQVGLMRTMQPGTCTNWGYTGKRETRYLVKSAAKTWDTVHFRGNYQCSIENQIL